MKKLVLLLFSILMIFTSTACTLKSPDEKARDNTDKLLETIERKQEAAKERHENLEETMERIEKAREALDEASR